MPAIAWDGAGLWVWIACLSVSVICLAVGALGLLLPGDKGSWLGRYARTTLLLVAVAIFAVCAFAALALERLGFRVTIALSLAFLLRVVERQGAIFSLVLSIAFAAGAFLLFDTLLRVPLPRGALGL